MKGTFSYLIIWNINYKTQAMIGYLFNKVLEKVTQICTFKLFLTHKLYNCRLIFTKLI